MHNNVSNMTRIENSGVVGEGNRGFEGPSSSNTDAFTVKRIMGRTPGLIKSKFLSVLDSSNGILHGISSKLEGFSMNSSTTADDDIYRPQKVPIGKRSGSISKTTDTDTEAEDILIEIESRKLKERRAHEEIKSGRFRHPNILTKITNGFSVMDLQNRTTPASMVSPSTTDSSNSTSNASKATTTNVNNNKSGHQNKWDSGEEPEAASAAAVTETLATPPLKIDITAPSDDTVDGGGAAGGSGPQKNISCAISTVSTSEYDLCIPSSVSCETTTTGGVWIRSESINSVPSWASTISLDSQTDETVIEFVRRFLTTLFDNPDKITLELKSEFGQVVRTEAGRLWFSRLVNAQRVKSKRVDEATFYSLVQYFAIVLFECHDCDDFSPAKSLMNMCFTFYHEICVPGIEPYREYLYLYLRDQPIWHSLRFWNAAFFDALQCERANKPIPKSFNRESCGSRKASTATAVVEGEHDVVDEVDLSVNSVSDDEGDDEEAVDEQSKSEQEEQVQRMRKEIDDDQRFQQNITFGQLGTFTCNMHAFGLSRELCLEFLRKQSTIANLGAEHEKLLKDNIIRMYRETDRWRE